MTRSCLIYTCGDKSNGLGHVKRQLVLADSLLSRGIGVGFRTPHFSPGYSIIEKWIAGRHISINDSADHSAIIIDIEHGPTRQFLTEVRNKHHRVIVVGGVGFPIHDQRAIDELVDLQIYQSIAPNDFPISNHLAGCQYLIINPDYLELRKVYGNTVLGHDVLVLMGGGDPHSLTDVFCEAVQLSINGNGLGIRTVIGAAADSPERWMKIPSGVKIYHAPQTLVRAFSGSRMAVSAMGMTTYEAMCVGLPVATVNWSPDHEATAKKLESIGATVNLGQWSNPDWKRMHGFITRMMDKIEWDAMSEKGKQLVDGLGVGRVAGEIERIL